MDILTAVYTKTCTQCGKAFPRTPEFFHLHAPSKDGFKPRCKRCQCASAREYMAAQPIERRKKWSSRKPIPEIHNQANKKWYRRNREKKQAQVTVYRALRSGRITKQPCEKCGAVVAQAHHDDYSKPLDVRWLCTFHHGEHHRNVNAEARAQEQAWTS